MSKLSAAMTAIDARLDGMQDAIRNVLSAVDNVAPWDATLAAIDALRPFVKGDVDETDFVNIIPPKLVTDPAPGGLRIVPAGSCNLCNPTEVCGLCKASLDAPRPPRESERAMRKLAEAAVAWHGLRDDELEGEIMPPQMSEACASDSIAFAHPPADPTDAYTMDGSQVCAFCGRPSYGSRLCCGCAAEQSGLG